jgi:hypothetical protein
MQCSKDNICRIGSSFTVHPSIMMDLEVADVTNLQGINQSMNRAWEFNSPTLFMAPLLWWSIEESSYQVFQVSSHSDSLSCTTPV